MTNLKTIGKKAVDAGIKQFVQVGLPLIVGAIAVAGATALMSKD